jgi:hypothetical protein
LGWRLGNKWRRILEESHVAGLMFTIDDSIDWARLKTYDEDWQWKGGRRARQERMGVLASGG